MPTPAVPAGACERPLAVAGPTVGAPAPTGPGLGLLAPGGLGPGLPAAPAPDWAGALRRRSAPSLGALVPVRAATPSAGAPDAEPADGEAPPPATGAERTHGGPAGPDGESPTQQRVVPSTGEVLTASPFVSAPAAEDVEATRLRPARGKVPRLTGREVTVELTDGQRLTFCGTALVGRNPACRPGEAPARLITVADPGRSVSKTHLIIGADATGVWVRDRASTNGTVVTLADGQQILCGAEQQVRLPAGATVAFGDYGLSVVPTDEA